MGLPLTPAPRPAAWQGEQRRWQTFYQQHLVGRLQWAVAYVRAAPPAEVRARFGGLLALLQDAARYVHTCAPQVEALVLALHPWPVRWGYWHAWEAQIRLLLAENRSLEAGKRALLTAHLAEICLATGRSQQARQLYAEALAQARQSADILAQAEVFSGWARQEVQAGRIDEAEQALRALRRHPHIRSAPPEAQRYARAHIALARLDILRRRGQFRAGARVALHAIRTLQNTPSPPPDLLARAWEKKATFEWDMDRFHDSLRSLQQALTLYRRVQDDFAQARMLGDMGLVHWSLFQMRQAEEALRASLHISERLNARARMTVEIGNLGLVYLTRGELRLAVRYLQRHAHMARQTNNLHEVNRARGNLGAAYFCLRKHWRALPLLCSDRAFSRRQNLLRSWAVASTFLGLNFAFLGEQARAAELLREAEETARRVGSEVLTGLVWRAQALLVPPPEAVALLRRSLEISQRRQRPFDQAACLLWLAKHAPREAERQALWQEAAEILQALEASAWLRDASPLRPPILPMLR